MVLLILLSTVTSVPTAFALGQNRTWTRQEGQRCCAPERQASKTDMGDDHKWVSFTEFNKCSDHHIRHVQSECSKAIWSHFFFYNPWSSHALPWVDSAHGTHPLGIKLPPDANSHHPPGHHWEPSSPVCHHSDEMASGCSLCLIKGIEECPSTGNPALLCLNPAAWVISDQSRACFPVISDKGPSDPWRSYLW